MADLTTFSGLKAAVADYLGRSDLTDQIPAMIKMCESRFNRKLRLRAMEHRAFAKVAVGASEIPLPERRVSGMWDVFLEMRDVSWIPDGGGHPVNLFYTTPDMYQVEMEHEGNPSHFTIEGNELFLLPTPDLTGTLKLAYYAEVEPLCDTVQTNEVLKRYPDLYLYGTLVESGPYTRGSVPIDMWVQYYQNAVNDIMQQESHARYPKNISSRPYRRV